jgi:hypothetical protein
LPELNQSFLLELICINFYSCHQIDFGASLAGWLAGWPAGWLTGWLTDWLAGWLVGWLVGL